MRRWKWRAILGVLLVTVGACATWLLFGPAHPLTSIPSGDFRRIKVGTTRGEVTAILGSPGDRSTVETEYDPSHPDDDPHRFEAPSLRIVSTAIWRTDTASIYIGFDQADTVAIGDFYPTRPSTESIWSRLRKRAGRLWREWFP